MKKEKKQTRKQKMAKKGKKKINDLDLKNWKQYNDIFTDRLWLIDKRDRTGVHSGSYHVNFIPQIPNQLMRRFTKQKDVVLDTFLGSGTTLIECRRLGRNGIGIELVSQIANDAKRLISSELPSKKVFTEILVGDSGEEAVKNAVIEKLKGYKREEVQLIIMHPPYFDIIKFSNKKQDLSNAKSVDEFLDKFEKIVRSYLDILQKDHYLAIIIGDKYANSEWVPLGFKVMDRVMKTGLKLKSIIVKNMTDNRAKRNQQNLWHYRALKGGFFIFKQEYILLFKKK